MWVRRWFLHRDRSFSLDILSQRALHGVGDDGLVMAWCSESVELEIGFNLRLSAIGCFVSDVSFKLNVSDRFLFMNWLSFIFCDSDNWFLRLDEIVNEWKCWYKV